MSDKSIIEQIKHYQKDITKCPDNSKRMLRCIERLTVLPITIAHLQETGVGRSVNELRKCGGEVGAAAGSLVCKWKSMVKDEEEDDDEESAPESDIEESKEHHKSPRADHRNDISQKDDLSQKHKKNHDKEDHRKSVSNKKTESNPSESSKADHRHNSSQKSDLIQKHKKDHDSDDHRKSSSSQISNKKTESPPTESKSSKSLDQKSSSKSNHKSNRDKSIKSGYNSCSDSKSSSHHKSKTDHHSKSDKKTSHSSKSECNGTIKIESSHPKHERTKSSTSNSGSDFSDAKTKNLKYKHDKERYKKEESSHKHNSSHKKYDLKRVESDSSDEDDTIYKPSSRKHKKSDSEEEQKYDIKKHDRSSYSKSSVKRKQYESSEESDNRSESDVEDRSNEEHSESQNSSDVDSKRSIKSNSDDNMSDNESDNNNRSSAEESGDQEDDHSDQDSDSDRDDSPEREKYTAVKIKREKESPPRHSKHQSSEKNKSSHNKSNYNSTSPTKKFKADNVIDKKDNFENIKIKKEKEESNKVTVKKSEKFKEKENKGSSDKNITKSSTSRSEGSSKQHDKLDKKVKVKIEKAEDGSIDCGSGASFGDALLGLSETKKKPVKRKPVTPNEEKSPRYPEKPKSSIKHEHQPAASSSKSTFKGPDLLSKSIKLEPLDVDLKATLPEISPNYKPLPHYSPPSSPANKKTKLLSQEEALSTIMSTKNQRTKVYSGNKAAFTKVPSLFDLCIQVLRDNIEALEYTGGVPYDLLKPVLDRATADQLYQLEHYNPYLVEDTDGLWQFHCNKDFRGKKPEEFETWREMYLRLLDEREKKLEALKANITQSMAKNTPIRQTKLAYVDSVVKPPRNIAKKQMKYGTAKAVKHDLVSKAMVGAASSSPAPEVVPVPAPPQRSSSSSFPIPNFLKKKKAPLMAKTLQLIKGNRFKR